MTNDVRILKPTSKPSMMDLVSAAGIPTDEWGNYKRGPNLAAANPAYCFEWCFEGEGYVVLNIGFSDLIGDSQGIRTRRFSMRARDVDVGRRIARAKKFDALVKKAFDRSLPVKVVILNLEQSEKGFRTKGRKLDFKFWHVSEYNDRNGEFVLTRQPPTIAPSDPEAESLGINEGATREAFIRHRHRESKLRKEKINSVLSANEKLACQVDACSFDFEQSYGCVGKDFIHVHHLIPLSEAGDEGVETKLEDLVLVCPNCHAMIHRGGENRSLEEISKFLERPKRVRH